MTIDYEKHKRIIIDEERIIKKPYVGFIAPNGNLLDFNNKNPNNIHDDWHNIVAYTFLKFVSFIIKDEKGRSPVFRGIDNSYKSVEELIEALDKSISNKPHGDDMLEFRRHILICLRNAYSGTDFFESLGTELLVTGYNSDLDVSFQDYLKEKLMDHFKDIAIMYLGYDSLERFDIGGKILQIPDNLENDFDDTPRIITTSNFKIGERFFNYLLMDWKIYRVPRYFFNEETKMYEKESSVHSFYQQEQEDEYEKEVNAIKKYVPKKDRHKYFI